MSTTYVRRKEIRYSETEPHVPVYCTWSVYRKEQPMAVSFHGRLSTDPHQFHDRGLLLNTGDLAGLYFYPHGIEKHCSSGRGVASQPHCSFLGTPCWHDGTSLGASRFCEFWYGNDERAFAECIAWMDEPTTMEQLAEIVETATAPRQPEEA